LDKHRRGVISNREGPVVQKKLGEKEEGEGGET
jgi:hypothetical protein